jgi:bifunctional DNA-binding transcriptional regulator/antitoxin component of YhaV-PrlF toxin-antitoxin module
MTMVTVKISDQSDLQIPRGLSDELSLSDGDRVELVRRGDVVILQKIDRPGSSKSLRELAGLVKSSRPPGSVDVSEYMNRRGYEYLRASQD